MHKLVNAGCAQPSIESEFRPVHNVHMTRSSLKSKTIQQPRWGKTYLREWRLHAGFTLEAAGAEIGKSHSQLGRIEIGKSPYTQGILEACATLYDTSIWALLYCPPDVPPEQAISAFFRSIK